MGREPETLTAERYCELRAELAACGYQDEYEWCQGVTAPDDAMAFFFEYGWVVVNSGMRNQVAEKIWGRILDSLRTGGRVADAFGHPGKAAAIQRAFDEREELFVAYIASADKVSFLAEMPWIGPITKWHLAKNFGVDCAKPDRHLSRLAAREGVSVDELCARLATATGDRVATVDLVLWRAANLGFLQTSADE